MISDRGLPIKSATDPAGRWQPPVLSDLSRPLAEALELEKGEEIEWVVQDKRTRTIRRRPWVRGREGRAHER
jgi:hypothetical protein